MHLPSLKSYALRHAISMSIVVVIAAFIDIYFSFSKAYWISLTAFLVCQTERGSGVRQGMIIFLVGMMAMLAASFLKMLIVNSTIVYILLSVIFFLGNYIVYTKRLLASKILTIVIFLSVLLIVGLSPLATPFMLKNIMLDMVIGAVIGIAGGQFILPVSIFDEFRQGIIPILQAFVDYTKLASEYLKQQESHANNNLALQKISIEIALQSDQGTYPEWIYEGGFNRGLRSGYRFFLIHIEWMMEIVISINNLLNAHRENILAFKSLCDDLALSMEKNQELLVYLIQYFKKEKINVTQSDYKNDISALEKTVKQELPGSIELLDISPEYVTLTALVSAVKDFRLILLQLITALPT